MPVFEYKGLTQQGKNTKGIIDAENIRAARVKLKKDGVYVIDLQDKKKPLLQNKKKGPTSTRSVPVKDLALMTRQLATLIKANIPLVDALSAVAEQVENPTLSEALSDCKNMVNEGSPFHKALAKYPNVFSNIFISMAEAGEMSGTLDVILMRLAEFTEAANELNSRVKSALTYPVIMLIVTLGIMIFLFTYVVPKITAIFESQPELKLPGFTIFILDMSALLTNYWWVFLIIIGIITFLFFQWKKTESGKLAIEKISLKMPVFGETIRMVAVSRFTRTLATLLNGGVPMLNAMQIVRNVVNNTIIAKAIDDARSNISEGESIAAPLRKSGQFPPIVIHMVSIGEKTGELENMLLQVSDAFDFQVKNKIESLTGLMGPVVLVIMGLTVAAIAFAVMIPMMELTSNLG
jgi:general secretion pathway protein F